MRLVAATGNNGKLREFREWFDDPDLCGYRELSEIEDIPEDGDSFQANAIIKSEAIYAALGENYLVFSDDSGISVPALGHAPGIYSARYAGENATDKDNLWKLVAELKQAGLSRTPAYYTCAIALTGRLGTYVSHGWMHGEVITEPKGDKGFGYDPMFIPKGYDNTLGELDKEIKRGFSHRSRALLIMKPFIQKLRQD